MTDEPARFCCSWIHSDIADSYRWFDRFLPGLGGDLARTHPYLLSQTSLFVAPHTLAAMQATVHGLQKLSREPAYIEYILKSRPEICRHDQNTQGVFFGYDFHETNDGAKLIEVNTNAGGGILALSRIDALRVCCEEIRPLFEAFPSSAKISDAFMSAFVQEWELAKLGRPLRHIAIVDEDPTSQYLYPEFQLCAALLRQSGIEVTICDPSQLSLDANGLHVDGKVVDLLYNRLTDFYLEKPQHSAIASAYLQNKIVLTPHPRAYALLADKRNLALWSEADVLRSLSIDPQIIAMLAQHTLKSRPVLATDAQSLWDQRKSLFFKPMQGYASRGAYQGAKLTRNTFAEIVASGHYLAQKYCPPTTREVVVEGKTQSMKLDLRNYCYGGDIQLQIGRLYRGQTTNMRSAGGGFTPLWSTSDGQAITSRACNECG